MSSAPDSTVTLISHAPHETERIGRELGALLSKGAFIALFGDLGGGKTCFTRGLVAGVAPQSVHLVASPTFAIMNEYPGPVPVYHFDFYRLGSSREIVELGFDDFFQGDGICVAEWSERLEEILPPDALRIYFHNGGEELRTITLSAGGERSRNLIGNLGKRLNAEEFL